MLQSVADCYNTYAKSGLTWVKKYLQGWSYDSMVSLASHAMGHCDTCPRVPSTSNTSFLPHDARSAAVLLLYAVRPSLFSNVRDLWSKKLG